MGEKSSHALLVGRRGELLAELLLQELGAEFIARPTADLGFDFFVGFNNPDGGINIAAVEVKATDRPVHSHYPVQQQLFRRLANSNIPVVLLVADVKQNKLFYAFPGSHPSSGDPDAKTIPLRLTAIDDSTKHEFRDQLANSRPAAPALH